MPRLLLILLALLAGDVLAAECPAGADQFRPVPAGVRDVSPRGDIVLDDGRTLRLAGIDWPAKAAARRRLQAELSALLIGERLHTAYLSGPDRWQRLSAQLFVERAGGAGPLWIQGELVENGLVHNWPEAAARPCGEAFAERGMLARQGRLGLWSPLARRSLRHLARGGALAPARIVYEGHVRSVRSGRSVAFVNFAGPRGAVPSLLLSRARLAELRRQGRDAATFSGKHIRVFAETDGGKPARLSIGVADAIEVIE